MPFPLLAPLAKLLVGKSILKKIKEYLPFVLVVLVTLGILYMVFSVGSGHGASKVQKKWDAETAAYEQKVYDMQQEMYAKELNHREETRNLTNELANAKQTHAVAIATLTAGFNERLRQSSERAGIYQYQAQAGAAEQRGLASHAARLDLAVVEGIRLVGELTATIRLRDAQLIQLGNQITADRKLIGDTDGTPVQP